MKARTVCRHDNKLEDGKCPVCLVPREQQHTPTPWYSKEDGEEVNRTHWVPFQSLWFQDEKIGEIKDQANAAFITRAVNNYDEHVALLKKSQELMTEKEWVVWDKAVRDAIAKAGSK